MNLTESGEIVQCIAVDWRCRKTRELIKEQWCSVEAPPKIGTTKKSME